MHNFFIRPSTEFGYFYIYYSLLYSLAQKKIIYFCLQSIIFIVVIIFNNIFIHLYYSLFYFSHFTKIKFISLKNIFWRKINEKNLYHCFGRFLFDYGL